MFAIYNNGSVSFRSTSDNLYELKKTEAPDRVLLKPNDDSLYQDYSNHKKSSKENKFTQEALSSYKKVANMDLSEPIYHVQDIMSKECVSIRLESTVLEAYDLLKEHGVTQIPIISSENKIMGLISKKFILNLIVEDLEHAQSIMDRKIEELYLPDLITTEPISDIRRVAKVMVDFKLDAIPVVTETGMLTGIVSKTDIIKAVSHLPKLQLWS